jgi:N-methylhydantoinase A
VEAFHAAHARTYGYSYRGAPDQRIEWVNLRVMGIGPIRRPAIQPRARGLPGGAERALTGHRAVFFEDAFVGTPIYARSRLQPGDCLRGPSVIEEFGSTTVVFPGQCASVDDYANLLLTRTEP